MPELNDLYSGWITNQDWRKRCHMLVKDSRDTYLAIIKKFKNYCETNDIHIGERLLRSFNEKYGLWSSEKNALIYKHIQEV